MDVQWKFYIFIAEAYLSVVHKRWKMTHNDKLTAILPPFQFSFQPQCASTFLNVTSYL